MKNSLFIIMFLGAINMFGQYETVHWFFGDHAGLDFTGNAPVPEPGSPMMTEEGCSSISTPCGDLILYTDGQTVWNANHQIMQDGTGLLGNYSSSQSGIIIPKPQDDNIYYIFTVDEAFDTPSYYGMCYTKVDMTLDGGLGGVVSSEKNINLVQHASEKVTAIAGAGTENGEEFIWVITLATNSSSTSAPYQNQDDGLINTFYAFKVTSSGIDFNAVVSTVNIDVLTGVGYMKVSPDGKKLAVANLKDGSTYLLDFNNVTGEISNPVLLTNPFDADAPYGVEFSPDSSKLYVSDRDRKLIQFDLNNNNNPVLIDSQQNYRSALQLGLDGKIYQPHTLAYMIGSEFINVIEYPNKAGTACSYKYKEITLPEDMTVHQGLPPFIQSYFTQIAFQNVTAYLSSTYEIHSNEPIVSADWDFGNGVTMTSYPDNPPDNTHTQVDYVYDTPGTYTITVLLHLASGCGDITVQKSVNIPAPIDDKIFCINRNTNTGELYLHNYDDEVNTSLNSTNAFSVSYYLSFSDALNQLNEISDPYTPSQTTEEIYYVATNLNTSITYIGKFQISGSLEPEINPVSSFEICDNDEDGKAVFDLSQKISEILGTQPADTYEVSFYPTQSDAENDTNEIENLTDYENINPFNDTVWYRITNLLSGCSVQNSVDIFVYPLIHIDMADQYTLCEGETLQVNAPPGFERYEWSTGDTSSSISINQPGEYSISVTNEHDCSNNKSFEVFLSNKANIEKIKITDFFDTNDNSFEVFVNGLGDYAYSIDGINYQDSSVFNNLAPGSYTLYIMDKNGCGITEKDINLLGAPQYFTPNGDTYNDFWQITNITNKPGSIIYIYDRYGKLITQIEASEQGWNGTINGQPAPASDYWFLAKVMEEDGSVREVKGHFSLKR